MNRRVLLFCMLVLAPLGLYAQPPGWNDPYPPHLIMDNVYYVGTSELSSFLIVTPEGHILVSSNYEASVPIIKDAVEQLGFNFSDIKILISGHAHPDHIEGDALVKEMTGAEVVVGRLEVPAVNAFKPFGKDLPVDRIVDDGDSISLGGTTMTAHVQSGHTKGCLAWSMDLQENGKSYYAFIECSLNGQYLQYVDNEDYPEIAEEISETYRKAREFPVEVFLSSHGQFYGRDEKYAKLISRREGEPNPFVDPDGYQSHVDQFEKTFKETLARQLSQQD